MFTGIIEEVGKIKAVRSGGDYEVLTISCSKVLGNNPAPGVPEIPTQLGDSIAVNGICLTVTEIGKDSFSADVMPETMRRTSLSELRAGSPVNLERAMPTYGRFGGHIVSGHIDGTGTVRSLKNEGNAVWFTIEVPDPIARYIIEKGSITVDGISLTVAEVDHTRGNASFKVSIIPHTLAQTALSTKKPGSTVNLENDIVGKYIEQLMQPADVPADQTKDSEARLKELLAAF